MGVGAGVFLVACQALVAPLHAAPGARDGDLVVASVELEGDRAAVERLLGDAAATARLSPDVTRVSATREGGCERMSIEARGPMGPLTLVSLRCPDGDGWKETLVSSDDFARHEVHWSLQDTPTGTRLTVKAAVEPDLPIPQRVVDAALQSSLVQQLNRIKAFLAD
jgi:hypothetical protein